MRRRGAPQEREREAHQQTQHADSVERRPNLSVRVPQRPRDQYRREEAADCEHGIEERDVHPLPAVVVLPRPQDEKLPRRVAHAVEEAADGQGQLHEEAIRAVADHLPRARARHSRNAPPMRPVRRRAARPRAVAARRSAPPASDGPGRARTTQQSAEHTMPTPRKACALIRVTHAARADGGRCSPLAKKPHTSVPPSFARRFCMTARPRTA